MYKKQKKKKPGNDNAQECHKTRFTTIQIFNNFNVP